MAKSLYILVVDDDTENADSLAELFSMDDHRVKVAHSGEAAIDAFKVDRFDVAFMDVMMPGKNGVDSFIEIKQHRPDAQVYFMTGYSADDLLKKALDHGAKGVFGKPVDLPRVLETIEAM